MIYDFSKIKGLLFDKDGTLFDFDKTWNAWTRRILREVSEKSGGGSGEISSINRFDLILKTYAAEYCDCWNT